MVSRWLWPRRSSPRHRHRHHVRRCFWSFDGVVFARLASRMAPSACTARPGRTRKEVCAKTTKRKTSETCANGRGRSPTTPRTGWMEPARKQTDVPARIRKKHELTCSDVVRVDQRRALRAIHVRRRRKDQLRRPPRRRSDLHQPVWKARSVLAGARTSRTDDGRRGRR